MPALVQARLGALLDGDAAWVPVNDGLARLLEGSCVGTPAGGPAAAADVAATLAAAGGPPAAAVSAMAARGDPLTSLFRLSLEEAFFLAFVLGGVLAACSAGGQPLCADGLWAAACEARAEGGPSTSTASSAAPSSAFPVSYAAYHHCRAKGWTVRSGLRYGADYALYPGHPAATHAAVLVTAVRAPAATRGGGGECSSTAPPPALQWLDIEIGNRLACQVGKRLLLLYVDDGGGGGGGLAAAAGKRGGDGGGGSGGGGGGGGTPAQPPLPSAAAALSRITVEERLVERWVPDTDREPPGAGGAVKAAAAAAARAAARAAKAAAAGGGGGG
jgi:uncharacterized membrane protein YgcG